MTTEPIIFQSTMLALDSFLAEQRASLEEGYCEKYIALLDDVVRLLNTLTKIYDIERSS